MVMHTVSEKDLNQYKRPFLVEATKSGKQTDSMSARILVI